MAARGSAQLAKGTEAQTSDFTWLHPRGRRPAGAS